MALGLSEEAIIEALCETLIVAGPGVAGGRYVGLNHPIGVDRASRVALEQLRRQARGSRDSS